MYIVVSILLLTSKAESKWPICVDNPSGIACVLAEFLREIIAQAAYPLSFLPSALTTVSQIASKLAIVWYYRSGPLAELRLVISRQLSASVLFFSWSDGLSSRVGSKIAGLRWNSLNSDKAITWKKYRQQWCQSNLKRLLTEVFPWHRKVLNNTAILAIKKIVVTVRWKNSML